MFINPKFVDDDDDKRGLFAADIICGDTGTLVIKTGLSCAKRNLWAPKSRPSDPLIEYKYVAWCLEIRFFSKGPHQYGLQHTTV
jgi:hypothetical protein